LYKSKLITFVKYWGHIMINYFHVILVVSIFLIWKETLPFIKNFDTEDKIKLISKIALILAIMVLTLFTQSVDTLIGVDGEELLEAELYIFGSSLRFDITEENEQELKDLSVLLEEVKIKYSLKFPKERYIGYTVKMYLDTKNGFIPFQVTDSNHIWYKGKFYKCTNIDLFSYLKDALEKQDIYDIPTN